MVTDNIKAMCKARGVTICELERKCGIGNGVIGKWGKSTGGPTLETAKKISDFFGCTLDELFAEKEERA